MGMMGIETLGMTQELKLWPLDALPLSESSSRAMIFPRSIRKMSILSWSCATSALSRRPHFLWAIVRRGRSQSKVIEPGS